MTILDQSFFDRPTLTVAKELLGKVIFHKYQNIWLKAQIIETEAYLMEEKASHASLGFTQKRKALFMPPGTIYMYYARGKDSFNISAGNAGDAVLIKSGVPYLDGSNDIAMIQTMLKLNPVKNVNRICSGQTLLAKSLNLKVKDWDQKQFNVEDLLIKDVGYKPKQIIQTTRLGIPKGRDAHLLYRFIDYSFVDKCTKKPKIIHTLHKETL